MRAIARERGLRLALGVLCRQTDGTCAAVAPDRPADGSREAAATAYVGRSLTRDAANLGIAALSVACEPDGSNVAVAGESGIVQLHDP